MGAGMATDAVGPSEAGSLNSPELAMAVVASGSLSWEFSSPLGFEIVPLSVPELTAFPKPAFGGTSAPVAGEVVPPIAEVYLRVGVTPGTPTDVGPVPTRSPLPEEYFSRD